MNNERYISDIFDRLAGTLEEYVTNYYLVNNDDRTDLKILPSYPVDYTIHNFKTVSDSDDWWVFKISGCQNINELPDDLKELVVSFLPRFFKQFPEYENAECLKLTDCTK